MSFNRQLLFLSSLAFLSFLTSLFFWGFWKNYLQIPSVESAVYTTLTGILMLSFWSLFAYLNNHKWFVFLFPFMVSLPILVFNSLAPLPLLAVALTLLGSFNLIMRVPISKNSLIKNSVISSLHSLSSSLTFIFLGLSLIYLSVNQTKLENFKLVIPKDIFSKIYQTTIKNLAEPSNNQLDSFKERALSNFESQIPNIRIQLISQGVVDENQIINQINQSRQEYLSQVDRSLKNPQEAGLDENSIKTAVESQLNSFIANNRTVIPYLATLSFFLTINFFSGFLIGIVSVLASIFLRLLIKAGLAKKYIETIEVERTSLT